MSEEQHLISKRGMGYHGYTPRNLPREGFSPARNFGMPSSQLLKHTREVGGTS